MRVRSKGARLDLADDRVRDALRVTAWRVLLVLDDRIEITDDPLGEPLPGRRSDGSYQVCASWIGMLTNQLYDHVFVVNGFQWRVDERWPQALDQPLQQRISPQFRPKTLEDLARFVRAAADNWTTLDFPFGPSTVSFELLFQTLLIMKQAVEEELGWDPVERFDHWQRLVLYSR